MEDKILKAGKIACQALRHGQGLIKVGASLMEVTDGVEDLIRDKGAGLAFPVQVSRNDIAAHYCPSHDDNITFQEGDLVKIDVGVHIDGFIGDTATTVDLGTGTALKQAAEEALQAALKLATPGTRLRDIGAAIESAIAKHGYSPVRNLSGHGLGEYNVHLPPTIPNYDNGDDTVLEQGQLIAIEPFATNGAGIVVEGADAEVFMVVARKPVRSQFAREALKHISGYHGLPFTSRWLMRQMAPVKVSFALRELYNAGVIRLYPPLRDKDHGLVAQAEHSVIVSDKPTITTLGD